MNLDGGGIGVVGGRGPGGASPHAQQLIQRDRAHQHDFVVHLDVSADSEACRFRGRHRDRGRTGVRLSGAFSV